MEVRGSNTSDLGPGRRNNILLRTISPIITGLVVSSLLLSCNSAAAVTTTSTTTPVGHTIASAGALTIGQTETGGGGDIDFWSVKLTAGDQLTVQVSKASSATDWYNFQLFRPGTTDLSFANAPLVAGTYTNGSSTDVVSLYAPSTGNYVLAVCESSHTYDCRSSGARVTTMTAYRFTTAVELAPTIAAAERFHIVWIDPTHVTAIINGPRNNVLKIAWGGIAAFPLTAYMTPVPGCSHGNYTCTSGQQTFAHGNNLIVWASQTNQLWCYGSFSGIFNEAYHVLLVDAKGRRTQAVPFAFACKGS
jgi:Bacterial pre-peptidase C-terminal domain